MRLSRSSSEDGFGVVVARLLDLKVAWRSWALTGALSLLFAVFLKPDIQETLGFFYLPALFSQHTWSVAVVACASIPFFLYMKRVGLDLFGGLAAALFFIVFLSTMYNKGNLSSWAVELSPCLASALLVAALGKDHSRNLLQGMLIASSVYLICNLAFIFRELESLTFGALEFLFFGYRNATFHIAIPAFVCSILLDAMDGKKCTLRSIVIYALALFELLVGYSATSAFAFVVLGVLALLVQFNKLRPFINGVSVGVAYGLMFFGVVIFRLQDKFGFLIEMMGRSLTFTGRTFIWDEAIGLINGSAAITGYGKSYSLSVNGAAYYAHNDILHILMMAGVVGLAILVVLIVLADKRLYVCRRSLPTAYMSAALLSLALIGLFESVLCPAGAFLLAFAYYGIGKADEVRSMAPQV